MDFTKLQINYFSIQRRIDEIKSEIRHLKIELRRTVEPEDRLDIIRRINSLSIELTQLI